MQCPHCGREIVEQASFCNYCGERVAVACQSCERLNPPDSVFCYGCGRSLTEGDAEPQEPAPAVASQAVPTGVACPRCGAANEPASAYCYECGLPLEGELRSAPVGAVGTAASAHLYRSPRKRAIWTLVFLVTFGVTLIVSFFSTLLEIDLLERAVAGEYLSNAEITANDDREDVIRGFYILALIATAVAFLFWIHRASANLGSLGAQGQRFSPGWALGWWFIPIMNLFRPYQVIREIWIGSDPDVTSPQLASWLSPWSRPPVPALLKLWWALWIITNFVGYAAFPEGETMDQVLTADWVSLGAYAIELVATVLAVVMVRQLTKRQDEKYRRILTG